MTWREIKPLELIRFDEERWFSVDEWLAATLEWQLMAGVAQETR